MTLHVHRLIRWHIRRLFTSGISPQAYHALLNNLRRNPCKRCREYFDQHAYLEQALSGTTGGPTVFSIERGEAAVFSKIFPQEQKSRMRLAFGPQKSILVWAPAAASVMLLLAVMFFFPQKHPFNDRFDINASEPQLAALKLQARGSATDQEQSLVSNTGFRVFRIAQGAEHLSESTRLSIGDAMTFTYTNSTREMKFLALFGVQADGGVRWYYPGYEGRRSIPIKQDCVDEPLDDAIQLSVNHRPGWLRIVAVFSPYTISVKTIEEEIKKRSVDFFDHRATFSAGFSLVLHTGVVQISALGQEKKY